MKILLVDDEVTMLNILSKVIHWNELGVNDLYKAKNAGEAKQILQSENIDIVICDIEMPRESGLELIAWIQGLYPDVVNIILTAHADFNYARSAISLGVYRYLLKPVSFEEMEETIRSAMEKLDTKQEKTKDTICEEKLTDKIEIIKAYINEHCTEVITRYDVEKLVHLNGDHINRVFKASTGFTLMGYVAHCRIIRAKRLLVETDYPVSEIALQVGYDSPAYFSKIFRLRTGVAPLYYRAKHVNK